MVSFVAWDQIIYLLKHYAALVDSAPCRPGFRGKKAILKILNLPSQLLHVFQNGFPMFCPHPALAACPYHHPDHGRHYHSISSSHPLFIVGVFLFHPALCSLCVTCCHCNQNGCHDLLTTCDLTGALCLSGNRPTNGNERAGCGKSETV